MIKELVEHIAKALVDDPEQVSVTEVISGPEVLVELRVGPNDVGRMIGRSGKVIMAVRALAQLTGAREAKRVQVEIV